MRWLGHITTENSPKQDLKGHQLDKSMVGGRFIVAHHNIGKRYETIFAITGASSPNCGDKIEVQLLFMACSP